MTYAEYKFKVKEFNFYDTNNIAWPVLGLTGEFLELYEKYITESSVNVYEMGDTIYYITRIDEMFDLKLETELNKTVLPDLLYRTIPALFDDCKLALKNINETVKKILRDDAGNITPETRKIILDSLTSIMWSFNIMCFKTRSSFEGVMLLSVEKIQDRKNRNKLNGSGDNR